ncbi:MAG: hypothetical protein Q9187_006024, partial [Circinaria calcarea]
MWQRSQSRETVPQRRPTEVIINNDNGNGLDWSDQPRTRQGLEREREFRNDDEIRARMEKELMARREYELKKEDDIRDSEEESW